MIIAIFLAIGMRITVKNNSSHENRPKIDIKNSSIFQNKTAKAKVIKVYDGDTVLLSGGEVVRYLGIDTPEIAHPPKSAECFGNDAKKANEKLVLGKTVSLVADQTNVDRYDRLLRHVFVEGIHVNHQMVKNGLAFALVYPPDNLYSKEFAASEKDAREKKLGIWGECDLRKRGRQ